MGEYATIKGTNEEVKIGTCESMYYIRASDMHKVNYNFREGMEFLSFRLPFKDEPEFEDRLHGNHNKGIDVDIPDIDDGHGTVQLSAVQKNGLLISFPCCAETRSNQHQEILLNGRSFTPALAPLWGWGITWKDKNNERFC